MPEGFLVPRFRYVNPATDDNPHVDPNVSIETKQAGIVSQVLHHYYPGHPWRVEADNDGKIVKVQIPVLMGPTNWYVIHFDSLKQHDRAMATIKRFGGEICERFNLPRARFSLHQYVDAIKRIPKGRRFHGLLPS